MKIKILCSLALAIKVSISTGYSINHKMLKNEANSFEQKIYSGTTIDEARLVKGLSFLDNSDKPDEKYTKFETLSQKARESNRILKSEYFTRFADLCMRVFQEYKEASKKSAVCILFEKIASNLLASHNRLQALQEFKSRRTNRISENYVPDNFLDRFFGDGSIPAKGHRQLSTLT